MPKRSQRRRANRVVRRSNNLPSGFWSVYPNIVSSTQYSTSSGAKYSTFGFSTNVLFPEFTGGTIKRNCALRTLTMKFGPDASPLLAASAAPLLMQLIYTTVDGIDVVMSKGKYLSTTNQVSLSFKLPFNMAEVRNVQDTAQIFSLRVFNPKGSLSVVQVFEATFENTWYVETTPT
jgi:hypothetical protein